MTSWWRCSYPQEPNASGPTSDTWPARTPCSSSNCAGNTWPQLCARWVQLSSFQFWSKVLLWSQILGLNLLYAGVHRNRCKYRHVCSCVHHGPHLSTCADLSAGIMERNENYGNWVYGQSKRSIQWVFTNVAAMIDIDKDNDHDDSGESSINVNEETCCCSTAMRVCALCWNDPLLLCGRFTTTVIPGL